jgi:glutamate 5-kinase
MGAKSSLIVVKLGSGLLANRSGGIDLRQIKAMAAQIATLRRQGHRVILVSSGAISCGMSALGYAKRPTERTALQACATIGQPRLMRAYESAFGAHKILTAQILLTSWDLDSRSLYANTQKTLKHLVSLNVIPIFNENDALSFEEIDMLNKFGDNDRLSAHVSWLAEANKLIILSNIDGLRTRPDGTGELIREVNEINDTIRGYAGTTQSERSVGGMISKLETARMMIAKKVPMVIADGREKDILLKIMRGDAIGTVFQPKRR